MKMSQERDEVEVDDEYVGDDPESNVRKSERKRQREKQRRSDLANAFDELAALLFKIEPDDAEGPGSRRKQRRRSGATDVSEAESGDAAGITRLDLIGRTVETLRRLHKENIELKHSLRNQASGDNNEVLVMVPTLTAAEDGAPPPSTSGPGSASSYQGGYYGHQQHSSPSHSSHQQGQQGQQQSSQDYSPSGGSGAGNYYSGMPTPPQYSYGGAPGAQSGAGSWTPTTGQHSSLNAPHNSPQASGGSPVASYQHSPPPLPGQHHYAHPSLQGGGGQPSPQRQSQSPRA